MQLTCPHCGQPITSENINIQRMAAVCSACHTVFGFDPGAAKPKRRKIKQPQPIESTETDGYLDMAFRTNFHLGRNEGFITVALMSTVFTFMTVMFALVSFNKPQAAFLAFAFGLFTLLLYYGLALIAYNKTHIEVSDEQIKVSRRPFPNPLTQPTIMGLAGIKTIRYEETAASKKESYDTPRYNVWAETVDGSRKLIAGDLIEDYAVFISQRLNELLAADADADVSRLSDEETESATFADAAAVHSESHRT